MNYCENQNQRFTASLSFVLISMPFAIESLTAVKSPAPQADRNKVVV